jgi:hypothetical protein
MQIPVRRRLHGTRQLLHQAGLATYDAHQGDFDYLLGDWEFTGMSREHGKFRGYWSAARLAEGAQILDEYRVVGDGGETYYVSTTLRAYNAPLDQWELVSAETGTGLQNIGTGHRVGAEVHIEQKFGVMRWTTNFQQIEAHRMGPPRSIGPLTSAKKPTGAGSREQERRR